MPVEVAYDRDKEQPLQAVWRLIESHMRKLVQESLTIQNRGNMLIILLDTHFVPIDEVKETLKDFACSVVDSHARGSRLPGDIVVVLEYEEDAQWLGMHPWSAKIIFNPQCFEDYHFDSQCFVFRSEDLQLKHPYRGQTLLQLENAIAGRDEFDSTRNARDLIAFREFCTATRHYYLAHSVTPADAFELRKRIAEVRLHLGPIGYAAYEAIRKEVEAAAMDDDDGGKPA